MLEFLTQILFVAGISSQQIVLLHPILLASLLGPLILPPSYLFHPNSFNKRFEKWRWRTNAADAASKMTVSLYVCP
jgi:hypothetical protein